MQTACNECGATLDVADDTRFLVCPSCQASLRVERQGNSVTTTKNAGAKKPVQKKKQLIDLEDLQIPEEDADSEIRRIERELASLDHQWQNAQLNTIARGQETPPDLRGMGAGVGILAIICIVVSVGMFFMGFGVYSFYPLLGVLLALFLGIADSLSSNHHNYRRSYESRRHKLMARLRELERK